MVDLSTFVLFLSSFSHAFMFWNPQASISCKRTSDSLPCNSIVAPASTCGLVNVTYNFTMCNRNTRFFNITLNPKTFYAISGSYTPVLPGFRILNGTRCKTFIETRMVDTCNDVLPSQFKVEGTLINAPKYTYCYAFKFYKFSPLRPTSRPTKAPALPGPGDAPTSKPTVQAGAGCLTPVPGQQGNCPLNYRCVSPKFFFLSLKRRRIILIFLSLANRIGWY
jgi:hypothetical protein